jgi:VanZ family protein
MKLTKSTYLIAALLWSIIILILCSIPGKEMPKINLFDNVDKIVHAAMFFIFMLLWLKVIGWKKIVPLLLIAIAYGIGLEFYQKYCIAGRSMDPWDAIADTFGAFLVFLPFVKNKLLGR